jgi:hypothetical protein
MEMWQRLESLNRSWDFVARVPVFISPRIKVSDFSPLSQSQNLQSVGQSVLVSGTHLGPATIFSPNFLLDYFLDRCGFVDMGRPLWLEVGSVVFSFCRASPAQPFSDLSPAGLIFYFILFYCLYFWDSANLESHVPVFISPRNSVTQLYPRVLGSPLSWSWS